MRVAAMRVIRRAVSQTTAFDLFGMPAACVRAASLPHTTAFERHMRAVALPRTVAGMPLHPIFTPTGDTSYRRDGWVFERSYVLRLTHGVSRASGVNLLPSGVAVDFGPGLAAPRELCEQPYRPLRRLRHLDATVLTLTTSWACNYFHWLFDVLPRLHMAEKVGIDPQWLYVPARHAFQRDTLRRLGYPANRIIDASRVAQIRATELIVPSLPGTPGVMPGWVCEFLRSRFLPSPETGESRRRIYVSREGASYRRVTNEAQLRERLMSRGFTIVEPGALPFADQVRLFEAAECVVAPHGAGLANLVFCKPGTPIIEILPSEQTNLCYWLLAGQVALAYHYVIGASRGASNDMLVDLHHLEQVLDIALAGQAGGGGPDAGRRHPVDQRVTWH